MKTFLGKLPPRQLRMVSYALLGADKPVSVQAVAAHCAAYRLKVVDLRARWPELNPRN